MDKITRLNKTIPKIYNPLTNTYVRGILEAWAQELEEAATQISNAKDETRLATASGTYLERIGADRGISKPILVALSDIYFRDLILKMSYTPKQIRKTMYEILDIFWGPTYSRSNTTSTIAGPYDIGTPFGLTGTISFIEDDVTVSGSGTLFTSELAIDDFIKITTEDNTEFLRVTRIIDDETLIIASTTTTKSGSGVALTPYSLSIKVDGGDESEILISPTYFEDTSTCTTDEMVEALNDNELNTTFSNVSVADSNGEFINIRTDSIGLIGKIQVTGGTANTLFSFATTQNTIYTLDKSTLICEVNPREIVLLVPNLVGNLERGLTGAAYAHNPISLTITAIDNTLKEITATSVVSILTDELVDMQLSQDLAGATITANTSGTTITISFSADEDLSVFVTGDSIIINPDFCTSFIYDPKIQYSVTNQRTVTTEAIAIGENKFLLAVDDAADIPNSTGFLCFDFGKQAQENLVPYIARPNNSLLQINSSYEFKKAHASGCIINFVEYGPHLAAKDLSDYAAYLTDTVSTLEFVQGFIDLIKASGVVLRWIVDYPEYRF